MRFGAIKTKPGSRFPFFLVPLKDKPRPKKASVVKPKPIIRGTILKKKVVSPEQIAKNKEIQKERDKENGIIRGITIKKKSKNI